MPTIDELLTIEEASKLASKLSGKNISTSNISYLIQYARIRANFDNGTTKVFRSDLVAYYKKLNKKEESWKSKLGKDVNWRLSFDWVKEKDRTKHIHRLHPYKGKFIPQLVEYFLDNQIDEFKQEQFFRPGDVVLDPFCGSGTTLVQANELGIHAIGIDISEFNALISNTKLKEFNLYILNQQILRVTNALKKYISTNCYDEFEETLIDELSKFNYKYFPTPSYKFSINRGEIKECEYSKEKEFEFLQTYKKLVTKYNISLDYGNSSSFLDTWYLSTVRDEIRFISKLIKEIEDQNTRDIITIILSRTIRSCRATTHSDLATLKEPVVAPYYCTKHFKICKPLFSILGKWLTYTKDTVNRLTEFNNLKTTTHQYCLVGDSRTIDIYNSLQDADPTLNEIIKKEKIRGIFSSPPYVGLIDYHEQHAYAYEVFNFERRDESEIGSLFKGQGNDAKKSYVEGVSKVLINCEKFLAENYDVFLVANDKYKLYGEIAYKSGMEIVNTYKRPVLNRTERDKSAYAEEIFHLKKKKS